MSDHQEAKQATPPETLLAELLDSRVPKSEREHAAAREIERLRQWEIVGREWLDKTDWMQSKDAPVRWLGKHRADALREEIERLTAERDELRRQLVEAQQDARRIDWLETTINERGEIHLHDGNHPRGVGIGLRPGCGDRTLREAIDAATGGSNE